MRVMLRENKPQFINTMEAVIVTENMIGKALIDKDELKQEIVKREDGKIVLRAHEIENHDAYESVQDIDIFVELGDILLITPKGYMKPVNRPIVVDKTLERAINKLNKVK